MAGDNTVVWWHGNGRDPVRKWLLGREWLVGCLGTLCGCGLKQPFCQEELHGNDPGLKVAIGEWLVCGVRDRSIWLCPVATFCQVAQ